MTKEYGILELCILSVCSRGKKTTQSVLTEIQAQPWGKTVSFQSACNGCARLEKKGFIAREIPGDQPLSKSNPYTLSITKEGERELTEMKKFLLSLVAWVQS